ncbi:MAG TPA: hypothetical protein VL326_04975, partial [Kofleriaceae bacterium]|nr:hypothetical protein [Kofleriaceae bacterium]
WLDDSQAMRGFVQELRQAAKQWASRGKPHDLVWRGATAQEALGHVKRHVLDLSAIEKEFVTAMRKQIGRVRRRRVLAFTTIFLALGGVIAGGAVALLRIQEAEEATLVQRDDAVRARNELQAKLDIIEAEKRAREAAEKKRQEEEERRRVAEESAQEAAKAEEMTKEQLQQANIELRDKVREAQAAKEKALAQEAVAKKASQEAQAAKREVEQLLEAKRKEVEKLKSEMKNIYNGDLTKPGGSK